MPDRRARIIGDLGIHGIYLDWPDTTLTPRRHRKDSNSRTRPEGHASPEIYLARARIGNTAPNLPHTLGPPERGGAVPAGAEVVQGEVRLGSRSGRVAESFMKWRSAGSVRTVDQSGWPASALQRFRRPRLKPVQSTPSDAILPTTCFSAAAPYRRVIHSGRH